MSGKILIQKVNFGLLLAIGAAFALAACDENGGFNIGGANTEIAADTTQSVQLVETDVEAPEAFQVSEAGLWDGRPSLGGVWIAHPDVTQPERVIIRNQTNGTFVIGALFRRERENPGPSLQVSSDAADALGMLAGAPAKLQVTALRREEVPEIPQPEAIDDFERPADITSTPLDTPDPISAAAAAIDSAELTAPEQTAPAPSNLASPFIQLGIFSIEENATRAANRMRDSGVATSVLRQESQGRTFWRVIAGPASTDANRADLLRQVKSQGFDDAYFVSN